MVKVYINLIKNGMKTIHDVPAKWRIDVQNELMKLGIEF